MTTNGTVKIEELLILYICPLCDKEHYFSPESLPGGDEHCEHCEYCGEGKLETLSPAGGVIPAKEM